MLEQPIRRRRLTLLLVPIACLVIASNVGSALAPSLVNDHPLWLLALDSRNRHLVLVAARVDPLSYYLVGALRLMLSDPLFYLLGFWFGGPALRWMDQRAGSFGRFLRTVEKVFAKASYPLVFAAPNNYICLFAGASRMPPPVFLALNLGGTVARLALFRLVGDVFEEPIDDVLGFISRNRVVLTVTTIALVVINLWWDRRKGTGELDALSELNEEIRADENEEHQP